MAHARDAVVPPSELQPGVPGDLEKVILQCLAKRPEDRFPDVASLERALAQCEAAERWTQDDALRWWQQVESVAEQDAASAVKPPLMPKTLAAQNANNP